MGFIRRLVARMDEIADRDADPDALTGRSSSRRHALPVLVEQSEQPVRSEHAADAEPSGSGGAASTARDARADAQDAQAALDRIRADQHRRMRGRSYRGGEG